MPEDEDLAKISLRQGAWNVLQAAGATGRCETWRHGKGFVTECTNKGLVVREGSEAVLTDRGQRLADRMGWIERKA